MRTVSMNKKLNELTETRIRAELARRDVNAFCEFAMRDQHGQRWTQEPFHREWQNLIPVQGPARIQVVAPRESAKTSQIVIARPVWELGRNPDLRIKIVCATEDLAMERVAAIAAHIAGNPAVRQAFPNLRPASKGLWPKPGAQTNRLVVARSTQEKDPSVSGHGILSSAVGGRADLVIFDDCVDFRNAISAPALRSQVTQAALEVWINMLGPEGRAVYVATVWHEEDLTMQLRSNPMWTVWWRPARDERTGALLWPGRWSEEALAQRELEIGSRAFARQFLLEPRSDEERTFSEEVISRCRDERWAPGAVEAPSEWARYAGVDLASTFGHRSSWTVMFTVAVDYKSERRYPLEIVRARFDFPQTIGMIMDSSQRHHHEVIYVENNGYQRAVVEALRERGCEARVHGFTTGQQKYDESVGIPSLSAAMERGLWAIPCGGKPHDPGCECGWCTWQRELRFHPGCATSDVLMAMWICDQGVRKAVGWNRYLDRMERWYRSED